MTELTDRDARLDALLGEMTDQLRRGRTPDVDAAARSHPDLADELRHMWGMVQFAEMFARPNAAEAPTGPYPSGGKRPAAVPAPRELGDFELMEELGRGGMGVVYKARQKSLNRPVALKMVLNGDLASDSQRKRFRLEAEAAARLQHPSIVAVHEVGEVDGRPYFCMDYIAGETLAQRVARGPLPPRDAARMLAAIAHAVDHAHRQGILHRDLKPSNVLLDSNGEPHVTDFGLAKRVEAASGPSFRTATGAIVGTPAYMPPEQAAGSRGNLSPASDVYSLGAILYECLTGRPPFQAATAFETLLLVLEQEPVPPRMLNPGMDRDLELICLKCLQKPAELRYAVAADLARDLEAFLNGEPLSVQSSGIGSFVGRMLRETHHAAVLENWGKIWMLHSLIILLMCLLTQAMMWQGVTDHRAYLALWTIGLVTWGTVFWWLRRRGGPVLFVERQLAHAWAAGVLASVGLFVIEVVQGLPALTLSPVLAVVAGMVFLFKAGTLGGQFYVSAAAYFVTAALMARFGSVGHLLFGAVSAVSFFVPGLKYYRLRLRAARQ